MTQYKNIYDVKMTVIGYIILKTRKERKKHWYNIKINYLLIATTQVTRPANVQLILKLGQTIKVQIISQSFYKVYIEIESSLQKHLRKTIMVKQLFGATHFLNIFYNRKFKNIK